MRKNLSLTIKILVVTLTITAFSLTTVAQKKRPTTKKPTTAAKTTTTNALEIKGGAEKVSIQVKNVSKFIYLLGGVARGIEDIDI